MVPGSSIAYSTGKREGSAVEKFEVIVVGGGLAGLSCAYLLAREGVEVLVLERGDYAGAKNVTGGRIYLNPIREWFPELFEKAPLERPIVREGATLMARERSVTFTYEGRDLSGDPRPSFSILRSRFDRWFAEQAEAAGAMILTKTLVGDVLRENGAVTGVIAGGDPLRADVVVACDGVLSLIPEKAGLREPGKAHGYAVGLKEVIALPPEKIEDRFNLEKGEGAAHLFVGEATKGRFGGGFLYTNRESLSLGVVIGIRDLMEENPPLEAPGFFDDFKSRPEVDRLIRGGEAVEYSAHVIPEGGYGGLGPLYGNGILVAGDAAGFALNLGITVRGMEYAMASGALAARTILKVRETGTYSGEHLSHYRRLLEDSFVLKDFETFKNAPEVLDNKRFFSHYPEWIGAIFRDLYTVPGGSKERLFRTLKRHLPVSVWWPLVKDLITVSKL